MKQKLIGMIGAMDMEIDAILAAAQIDSVEEHSGMRFTRGILSGVPFAAARCSEGKVNSAVCAQAMIDRYRPDLVLNIGVAGGLGPNVHIGDVVVATACVQYDFDGTALGTPLGEISVPQGEERVPTVLFPCDETASQRLFEEAGSIYEGTVHRGVVATGDRFVADPKLGNWLFETFGALACEMEGASIAHACMMNLTPCAVLRTISDNANDPDTVDFRTFAQHSAQRAQELLKRLIPKLAE